MCSALLRDRMAMARVQTTVQNGEIQRSITWMKFRPVTSYSQATAAQLCRKVLARKRSYQRVWNRILYLLDPAMKKSKNQIGFLFVKDCRCPSIEK